MSLLFLTVVAHSDGDSNGDYDNDDNYTMVFTSKAKEERMRAFSKFKRDKSYLKNRHNVVLRVLQSYSALNICSFSHSPATFKLHQ